MKDTYYARSLVKKRQRRKQVRRNLLLLLISLLFIISIAFYASSFFSVASGLENQLSYKYYKSIQISKGDTLWSIAKEHMDEHYTNTIEYIQEIKKMNSLKTDNIVSGNHIIIPYYSSEFLQ